MYSLSIDVKRATQVLHRVVDANGISRCNGIIGAIWVCLYFMMTDTVVWLVL